jgi:uncharacterized protein
MVEDSHPENSPPPKRQAKCPICGRASEIATRPFCSARCANVDLSRWLSGGYTIAVQEDAEEDETVSADSIARSLQADLAGDEDEA